MPGLKIHRYENRAIGRQCRGGSDHPGYLPHADVKGEVWIVLLRDPHCVVQRGWQVRSAPWRIENRAQIY
jgi:hypothetical protein